MASEAMNLQELADYLRKDVRVLERLASRGKIPGRRVEGRWRFQRSEILHWLETRLQTLSGEELAALEQASDNQYNTEVPALTALLSPLAIQVPLGSKSKVSVLRELVAVAERSGQIYQPDLISDAVLAREKLHTTALDCGAALPHWRRPLPRALGESVIAYGRSLAGIPFGAERGCLTDIFFLILCRNDQQHLHIIARIARLLQSGRFLDSLRDCEDAESTYHVIRSAEADLVEKQK